MKQMIIVRTSVRKAEIYRRSAAIMRYGSAELEEGGNRICITGIPGNAERESLMFHIPGCQMQGPVSIEQRKTEQDEAYRNKAAELEEKMEDLENRLKTTEDICELYRSGGRALTGDDCFGLLTNIADRFAAEREKYTGLLREKRLLEKEIRQLQESNKSRDRSIETVAIASVTVERAGAYDVFIEYRDRNVTWTPLYDILVPSVKQKIGLSLNAMIRQKTEEDWEDAELVLHTGDPEQHPVMPRLSPWKIREMDAYPSVAYRSTGDATTILSPTATQCMMLPNRDSLLGGGSVMSEGAEIGTLVTEYRIKGRWNIPAGDAETDGTIIKIDSFHLDGEFMYSCVPKYSGMVFLTALVRNIPIDKMPAAMASVYFENRYMGQIKLDPASMPEGVSLSLGVDQGMKAARTQHNIEENKAFMSGKVSKTYEYELSVQSMKDREVNVVVRDQIPVTDKNQVTVEAGSLPEGMLYPETGEMVWKITVPPGNKAKILFTFTVTYPQNMRIRL